LAIIVRAAGNDRNAVLGTRFCTHSRITGLGASLSIAWKNFFQFFL
jgi:hypothetical protein